jgi:hypothetical protein
MKKEEQLKEEQQTESTHEQLEKKLDRLWEDIENLKVKPPMISVNISEDCQSCGS